MAAPLLLATPSTGTITVTRYFGLAASAPGAVDTSATEVQVATPVAGNISITGLTVVSTVPITTGTWTATLRKNLGTPAPTLTCSLSSGATATVCTDNFGATGDHLEVNAGDTVDLMIVPTGSPTPAYFGFTFLMRSNDGQSLPLFAGTAASVTLASASPSFWQGQIASVVVPQAGHIQNLYVSMSVAAGAGNTDTVTVWYGTCGSETSGTGTLVATITGAGVSTGNDLNPAHGFDVVPGNCLLIVASGSASAPAAFVNASVQWSKGTTGSNYYYPYFAVGTSLITTVAGRYCNPTNAAGCYVASWAAQMPDLVTNIDSRIATAGTIYAMTGLTSGTPRNWTLVAGGATTGNPTCQQGAASATCGASSGSAVMSPGTSYSIYNILTSATGTTQTVWRAGYAVATQ